MHETLKTAVIDHQLWMIPLALLSAAGTILAVHVFVTVMTRWTYKRARWTPTYRDHHEAVTVERLEGDQSALNALQDMNVSVHYQNLKVPEFVVAGSQEDVQKAVDLAKAAGVRNLVRACGRQGWFGAQYSSAEIDREGIWVAVDGHCRVPPHLSLRELLACPRLSCDSAKRVEGPSGTFDRV